MTRVLTTLLAVMLCMAVFSAARMKGEKLKLVISEKPSVAQSIAAVIGTKQRGDGYLEGGGLSWLKLHDKISIKLV